jgi:hypothetical protein
MTLLRTLAALLLFSALPAGASGPIAGPPPLHDQNGKQDSLEAHSGRPVVVLAVNGERLRQLKGWEVELRERFDGLDFIRVVDIPQQPGVQPEGVARKLRDKLPQDVSVLIDMDGVWASTYDLERSDMNVVLFDREGRLVARFAGKRDDALVERISREIEAKLGVTRKPNPGQEKK